MIYVKRVYFLFPVFIFLSSFLFSPQIASAVSGNWLVKGPYGLTSQPTGYPPYSTNEVFVVSPTASTTAYVGTLGGGIFKTTNGGDSWQSINTGLTACEAGTMLGWVDGNRQKLIQALAIDPNNASVLWVAASCQNNTSTPTIYIYKSIDAGANWVLKRTDSAGGYMHSIRVAPSNSNIVYFVHTVNQIIQTTDGGSTFSTMTSTGLSGLSAGINEAKIYDLIVDPITASTLFALTTAGSAGANTVSNAGVFKSTDSGNTWSAVNGGLIDAQLATPLALKMAGNNPSNLYLSTNAAGTYNLFKTTNGGTSWTIASSSTSLYPFRRSLNVDTSVATTLYTMTETGGFLKSIDSGTTWTQIGDLGAIMPSGENLTQPIVQAPTDVNTFYVMLEDSIYRSTNGGVTWVRKDTGLTNLTVRYVIAHPTDSSSILAITTNPDRLYKTADNGATWQALGSPVFNDFTDFDTDKVFATSTKIFFKCVGNNCLLGSSGGVVRSLDGGATWDYATTTAPYVLEYSPTNNTLYAIFADLKLWKSTNDGNTWTVVGNTLLGATSKIAVSQINTNYIYNWAINGQLIRSIDAGVSWGGNLLFTEGDLVIDQTDPNILYVASRASGVKKSINGGTSWTTLTGWPGAVTPDVISVTIDPVNHNAIYASSYGAGVFVSTNAGGSWTVLNTNLGNFYIQSLSVNPQNTSIIWGATRGSSVWQDPAEYGTSPVISSISPSSPEVGATITINGSGFGATQGVGRVIISGTEYTPVSWSDTGIVVTLSYTIASGATTMVVDNNSLNGSLPYSLTITVPNPTPTSTTRLSATDVLGQFDGSGNPDLTLNDFSCSPISNKAFCYPTGTAIDPTHHRLFVVDEYGYRVLVYTLDDTNHLVDHQADYVLGQADFVSNTAGVTASAMQDPYAVAVDSSGNRLFVVDSSDNRVLVYDFSLGITNGMDASYVLGQADFVSSAAQTTSAGMSSPSGVWYDETSGRLFVADKNNNRVLVFDLSLGVTNGMSASYVLGQSDYVSSGAQTTATGMSSPSGVIFDSSTGRLFVADTSNNRVLVFDLSSGITNGNGADYVLGQPNMTSAAVLETSANSFVPKGLALDTVSQVLYVSDSGGHRMLGFPLGSLATYMSANVAFPTLNFVTVDVGGVSASAFATAGLVTYDASSGQFYLSDSDNNRVLIFALPHITTSTLASGTVGTAYSATLSIGGGTAPYACSVTSGALPTGTSLDASTCVLSGTPTSAASYSFTVGVSDDTAPLGITTKKQFTLEVVAGEAEVRAPSAGGNGPVVGSNISVYGFSRNIATSTQPITSTTTLVITTPAISVVTNATSSSSVPIITRNLSLHTKGNDVKALQKYLNQNGYTLSKTGAGSPGKETNYFGSATYRAVAQFQKDQKLPTTGYFGPMTRGVLNSLGR